MKTLLLTVALLALTASVASAGGISLAWNDCLGAGGATNRTFACDTNVGSNDLYVSFDPPQDIPDVNGSSPIVDLYDESSAALPAWWQFKYVGACRRSVFGCCDTVLTGQTNSGSCASIWSAQATPGIAAYIVTAVLPSMPFNRARILGSVSVPSLDAAPVHPGTEYTVMVVRIKNAKTTGLGACAGCQDRICLMLSEVLLTSNSSGDFSLRNSVQLDCPGDPGTTVYWQGSDTPTVNRTWGQLKSLYR